MSPTGLWISSPSRRRALRVPLLVPVLLFAAACSGGGSEPKSLSTPSSPPSSATPSAQPSAESSPPPVFPAKAVFEGFAGYRLKGVRPEVRERATRSFTSFIGSPLHSVALKRVLTKEKRKPAISTVIALSVTVEDEASLETFQTEVIETLSQQASSSEVTMRGRQTAYFSEDATPRHLARMFFFIQDTVLVQVFGPEKMVRDVSSKLIGNGLTL